MKRLAMIILAFAVLPLALAACNKTEPVAPLPPPPPVAPPPEPAPPPPPPADPVADITVDNAEDVAAALEAEIDGDQE